MEGSESCAADLRGKSTEGAAASSPSVVRLEIMVPVYYPAEKECSPVLFKQLRMAAGVVTPGTSDFAAKLAECTIPLEPGRLIRFLHGCAGLGVRDQDGKRKPLAEFELLHNWFFEDCRFIPDSAATVSQLIPG